MVTTMNPALADRMRLVKGQGQSPKRRYWHVELGFNYRMTNICAAIGLAQLEHLDAIVRRKRNIAALYRKLLGGLPVTFQKLPNDVVSSDWLVSLLLPPGTNRDVVMAAMRGAGVDSRPVFFCAHHMPMYERGENFVVSEDISARGLSLPSYPGLTDDMVRFVAKAFRAGLVATRHSS